MNILNQKDGRNKKYFEIQEDGVFVRTLFAKELNEYKVHFNDIQNDESVFRKSKDPILIGIVVSVILNSILLTIFINDNYNLSFSAGMIVFGIAIIPSLLVTALCNNEFKKDNSKSLAATKPLIFSYSNKQMTEVDSFISKIKECKKNYYLKTYYKVDNLIPPHIQISRIHWLYENQYITESDATFIIAEINSKKIIDGLY
ncbi:hypothetical protein [Chryseobacterium takakiae]|uniref:Uncharacterized protein n=1 Tax=Chryseobacterium takakiae TaxID=1302685 RepID=A0A1M4T0Y9_9FLAO|nr:hypothetical protein [Chryseobacterium takakiae]SHE38119.1 hypothetical protein SAMN05444408_101154 [Chryseobacterium takakiae]